MSLEKHSLVKEFPGHHHTIRHLKMHDAHFTKLFDEYHDLDHEIFELERKGSPTTDQHLEEQKLKRVQLKDQLFNMIKKEEASQ
jgi:uncharacterized protein YdcH (DUF465 family)